MSTTKFACNECGVTWSYNEWNCPNCFSSNITTQMSTQFVPVENVKVAEGELLTWMKKAAKNIKKES